MDKYLEILGNANDIALATSDANNPNVRIVNYYLDPKQPNVLYFASDRASPKVAEFLKNDQVAFTTIPHPGEIPHVRSISAAVKKSGRTIDDMAAAFVSVIPGYDETIKAIGHTLDVFEIHVAKAAVIVGFEAPAIISF